MTSAVFLPTKGGDRKWCKKTGRHTIEGELGNLLSECREETRSVCPDFSVFREALFMRSLQKFSFNYLIGNRQQFDKKFNRKHRRWIHLMMAVQWQHLLQVHWEPFSIWHALLTKWKINLKIPIPDVVRTNIPRAKNGENTSKVSMGTMPLWFYLHVWCWKSRRE